MSHTVESNFRPEYDQVILDIADYVLDTAPLSTLAYETAHLCLFDALSCGILALGFSDCRKLLGPIVPGATLLGGARVPGTNYELDPVQAAFNIGTMIRWLDFNDTWLAAEWGHPSDNLGGILSIADYVSRQQIRKGQPPLDMHTVLTMMIKAYEIQGCLALENSFNRMGLDHVVLVKIATAAVVCVLLGADKDMIHRTLSQVFVDGQSLRTYRHAPNTGSRKSWAAGDAGARAVRLALLSMKGEMGYPSALTVPKWGFYDVSFSGNPFLINQTYNAYVMEHVLFKISYPAEFHAQTAVECAVILHSQMPQSVDSIESIHLYTQESAIRIISKQGPLYNPADRDHCLQYMVAVALLYGDLKADYYEDDSASDPRIDSLRAKMIVLEDPQFSKDYLDPDKRSIANRIQLTFTDGTQTKAITIEYPLGHPRRRAEGLPVLKAKCERHLATHYSPKKVDSIMRLFNDKSALSTLSVTDFMELWIENDGALN